MKADEMIDYVLGQVDGADRERLEQSLRDDGEPAVRVERLRQAIYRLLDDGTPFEHPPDLAQRTVTFVARNRRRTRSLSDYVPIRVPFRWADFAVAASIFVAGVLTLLPAIQRSRERMNQAGCVFNLQQLGNSFGQYASVNQLMPYPPSHRADAPAGVVRVDAARRRRAGRRVAPGLPLQRTLPAREPRSSSASTSSSTSATPIRRGTSTWSRSDYAYNIGYRHASGHPGPLDFAAFFADPRAGRPAQPRRPEHQGRQQPESRRPGAERALRRRQRPMVPHPPRQPHDPDIFLNNDHQPRPGLHERTRSWCPATRRSTAGEARRSPLAPAGVRPDHGDGLTEGCGVYRDGHANGR